MKKIVLNIIFCAYIVIGYAQDAECGFLYSNSDIVAMKEYKKNLAKSVSSTIRYFPIQHHIVRYTNGTGGLSSSYIASIEQTLNRLYAGANVQFYSCEAIDFIDEDTFYDFTNNDEFSILNYNNPNSINIYYFNTINGGALAGYTYLPTSTKNFIAIANAYANNGSTIPHEMGHFFGLLHTHDTRYGLEYVDGTNCTLAGDLYCDTPADPQLSSSVVDDGCIYVGTTTDPHGDIYTPDTRNIMSYSRKICRTQFSNEQLEDISYWADAPIRQQFSNTLFFE